MTARKILVLLSTAGGGDRQPVISLAFALHERGHHVTIVCDTATVDLVSEIGIPTVAHQVDQVGFISQWVKLLAEEDSPPNPFLEWGTVTFANVRNTVSELAPEVIVGSLFCMGLADLLAEDLGVPWCFVNPSFYFGAHSKTSWEDDWYGSFVPRLARECLAPLVERADMVLHATDPIFDFVPVPLPTSHDYVGFLLWEPSQQAPPFLAEPGDPWALVTASTSRPADEETMLQSAVTALADQAVRTVLTLPKHDSDAAFASNVLVTGFSPHIPILEKSVISINQAGHGIVSKCLTYGVPMVLLPWDADQPGVAARAEALGVAVVVPRDDVSPERMSTAVAAVLGETRFRATAEHISRTLSQRSPTREACDRIEAL